jgi:hypothetical protein
MKGFVDVAQADFFAARHNRGNGRIVEGRLLKTRVCCVTRIELSQVDYEPAQRQMAFDRYFLLGSAALGVCALAPIELKADPCGPCRHADEYRWQRWRRTHHLQPLRSGFTPRGFLAEHGIVSSWKKLQNRSNLLFRACETGRLPVAANLG